MGIEYRHFLVVDDAEWRPQSDTAARVEAVLRKWSLVDRPKEVVDLSRGANKQIDGDTTSVPPGPEWSSYIPASRDLRLSESPDRPIMAVRLRSDTRRKRISYWETTTACSGAPRASTSRSCQSPPCGENRSPQPRKNRLTSCTASRFLAAPRHPL